MANRVEVQKSRKVRRIKEAVNIGAVTFSLIIIRNDGHASSSSYRGGI